jgi:hypothetical protein
MAKVRQRTWTVPGQRTKRKAWGYVGVDEHGKQVRVFKAEWSREDAEAALSAYTLKVETPKTKTNGITFAQAAERYVTEKSRKRSLAEDRRHLTAMRAYFGADTPLAEVTASAISAYKASRLAATCPKTGQPYSPATVNRSLAALRHMLKLAREEWEVIPVTPRIRLEREPEGRIRWLEPDEEARLLAACRLSRNKGANGRRHRRHGDGAQAGRATRADVGSGGPEPGCPEAGGHEVREAP